jgi:LPXTG-motif cell wall-anchored protein
MYNLAMKKTLLLVSSIGLISSLAVNASAKLVDQDGNDPKINTVTVDQGMTSYEEPVSYELNGKTYPVDTIAYRVGDKLYIEKPSKFDESMNLRGYEIISPTPYYLQEEPETSSSASSSSSLIASSSSASKPAKPSILLPKPASPAPTKEPETVVEDVKPAVIEKPAPAEPVTPATQIEQAVAQVAEPQLETPTVAQAPAPQATLPATGQADESLIGLAGLVTLAGAIALKKKQM